MLCLSLEVLSHIYFLCSIKVNFDVKGIFQFADEGDQEEGVHQLVVHHCASGSVNNYSSQFRDVWWRLQVPLWVLCLTFQKEVLSYALACPLAQS